MTYDKQHVTYFFQMSYYLHCTNRTRTITITYNETLFLFSVCFQLETIFNFLRQLYHPFFPRNTNAFFQSRFSQDGNKRKRPGEFRPDGPCCRAALAKGEPARFRGRPRKGHLNGARHRRRTGQLYRRLTSCKR